MRLIFLDIDGVLNHQKFYTRMPLKERIESRRFLNDEWGEVFCPVSTALLNDLITKTGAKVVISSTKRSTKYLKESYEANLRCIQKMWKNRGFVGEVIGTTPHLWIEGSSLNERNDYGSTISRGKEIEAYLKKNLGYCDIFWSKEEQQKYLDKSHVENYIIIDDDSDMLYTQRNHFVHCLPPPRCYSGFNKRCYNDALKKLSMNSTELNYANRLLYK